MAGDTLRGIGKKQIAEALETPPDSSTPAEASEKASTRPSDATADIDIEEGRPVRSLDELPSDRTGRPTNETTASLGISAAEVAANAELLGVPMADAPAVATAGPLANHSHVMPLGPSHTLLHAGS